MVKLMPAEEECEVDTFDAIRDAIRVGRAAGLEEGEELASYGEL